MVHMPTLSGSSSAPGGTVLSSTASPSMTLSSTSSDSGVAGSNVATSVAASTAWGGSWHEWSVTINVRSASSNPVFSLRDGSGIRRGCAVFCATSDTGVTTTFLRASKRACPAANSTTSSACWLPASAKFASNYSITAAAFSTLRSARSTYAAQASN